MCDKVGTIYSAIEYIESCLQTEITVAQIADAAGYSLFHFLRTFNRVVHHTPYDYLTRRRLSEAARTLIECDRRIIDISLDYCFKNQESFSRAFKRMFDVLPSQWRDACNQNLIFAMPPITFEDLKFINRQEFSFPVITEMSETTVHGLMTALDSIEPMQSKKKLLTDLCDILCTNRLTQFVTISSPIQRANQSNVYLFLGIENYSLLPEFPMLALKTIPAGRYVKISAPASDRTLAMKYLYCTWFPRMGRRPALPIEIEFCSAENGNLTNTDIYIPIELDSFPAEEALNSGTNITNY